MYRTLKSASASSRPQAVAVFLPTKTKTPPAGVPDPAALKALLSSPEVTLEVGQTHTIHGSGAKGVRTLVIGLGEKGAINAPQVRLAGASAMRSLHRAKVSNVAVVISAKDAGLAPAAVGQALADGMSLANFNFTTYHGQAKRPDKKPAAIDLAVSLPAPQRAGFAKGLKIAKGVDTARTLACTPPNIANPKYVAGYCRSMARKAGLKCTVIDQKKMTQLKMGGLLAVGRGSETPPCVVVLEWAPAGTAKQTPILLVGKGVTFDTGGYSLKSDGGKGMKYDKCGGMNVIGTMQAIANLKVKRRVVAIVGLAENMIDAKAYRVDDIVTFCNGVTCEVTNTDAEGRLVLADCLAYGTKTFKPAAVIDFATLTGGVVVALGKKIAGVWCEDAKLMKKLNAAADATGEAVWRLPLNEDYRKMMKSRHADLHNSAPVREAHPIQGAAFLSYFVGSDAPKSMPKTPWAHVDIAGTSNTDGGVLMEKGPTAFGVQLATELIENW